MIYIIQDKYDIMYSDFPREYRWKFKFPIAIYEHKGKRLVKEIDQYDVREGLTFKRKQYICTT